MPTRWHHIFYNAPSSHRRHGTTNLKTRGTSPNLHDIFGGTACALCSLLVISAGTRQLVFIQLNCTLLGSILIYLCVFILNYERQIIARILFGNSSSIYIKNRPKYVIDSETVHFNCGNTKNGIEFSVLKN